MKRNMHSSERNDMVRERSTERSRRSPVELMVSEPVELKVSGVMDLLEQEFQVLTAIEQGKVIGGGSGSGGDYGSGGDMGSGGPNPDMNNFMYKQEWNSSKNAYDCYVSFDDGASWGNSDVCLNTDGAGMTATSSGGGIYNMDPTIGTGSYYYNEHLTGNSNFHDSLLDVMERDEGGIVYTNYDYPTYAGIRQETFSTYAQQFGLPDNTAGLQKMSVNDIATVYHDKYWNGIDADQIGNQKFAHELFSLYVNSQGHAIEALQKTLNDHYNTNLTIDGAMGPNTLQALNLALEDQSSQNPVKDFVNSFNQEMKDKYSTLDGYDQFGPGWDNRVDRYKWDNFYQSSGN